MVRWSPRLGVVAVVALVALLVGAALLRPGPQTAASQAMKAGVFTPPHTAPEFSLRGTDGSGVTLTRYRGKVVLLTFGFTHCAAVCPTTLATLAQARTKLGTAANTVQVIYVTVDPARDSVEHMRSYLAAFDPSFIGATAAPEVLAAMREKYGVSATRQGSGADYAVAHTSSIFLIDRAGTLRAVMPFGHDAGDFAHDVRLLLG